MTPELAELIYKALSDENTGIYILIPDINWWVAVA